MDNKNYNTNFEYRQINSKNIVSDISYQRPLDHNRVKQIVSRFNQNLVNPIKVSYRDGKYYVFDGQHTMQSLKLRNNGNDLMVDCKVYYGLTMEDEAKLFSEQNGIQRQVETNARLKALYISGDVDIIAFKKATDLSGVRMDFTGGNAFNKISACGTSFKIFKKLGSEEYIKVLDIIKDSWGGVPESFRKEILTGTYLFHSKFRNEYDSKIAISQFRKISPISVINEGKLYTDKNQGYMMVLLQAYNRKLRSNKLEINI